MGSRRVYDLARDPRLLAAVVDILGEDVILWGSSLVVRGPGDVHPWHTDLESADPHGGTLSVWLALENVSSGSSLRAVRGSHRFGVTLQEEAGRHDLRRGDVSDAEVAGWAAARDPRSGVVGLDASVGDAVLFDGRLWHASSNATETPRTALLLQYARPDLPIRMPDLGKLDWPYRYVEARRPPCVVVHGRAAAPSVNLVVEEPAPTGPPASARRLPSLFAPLELPLAGDEATGWRPHPLFQGSTGNLAWMSSHASVLAPGRSPHPPHRHAEEEILILLDGAAELVLVDDLGIEHVHPVRRGQWSYYPPGQLHTLRTTAAESATYLMFKWIGRAAGATETMPTAVRRWDDHVPTVEEAIGVGGFAAHRICDQATGTLHRLEAHCSTVTPGGGYEPHRDAHDVAIVLFSGRVESLGEVAAPNAVLFAPAGKLHGLRNPGPEPASYLVFEFHGSSPG